jgi:hypothetical protein
MAQVEAWERELGQNVKLQRVEVFKIDLEAHVEMAVCNSGTPVYGFCRNWAMSERYARLAAVATPLRIPLTHVLNLSEAALPFTPATREALRRADYAPHEVDELNNAFQALALNPDVTPAERAMRTQIVHCPTALLRAALPVEPDSADGPVAAVAICVPTQRHVRHTEALAPVAVMRLLAHLAPPPPANVPTAAPGSAPTTNPDTIVEWAYAAQPPGTTNYVILMRLTTRADVRRRERDLQRQARSARAAAEVAPEAWRREELAAKAAELDAEAWALAFVIPAQTAAQHASLAERAAHAQRMAVTRARGQAEHV